MQDRVSLYPGRVKLVPVAGQENTYDMVRADSPTQEGTTLNKDSLLKDTTAALFGLGADAVPDDVLAFLGKYNQHWWKRVTNGVYIEAEGSTITTIFSDRYNTNTHSIKYSDSVVVDSNTGNVSLSEPIKTISISVYGGNSGIVDSAWDNIKGKYFIPHINGADADYIAFLNSNAEISYKFDGSGTYNALLNVPSGECYKVVSKISKGETFYVYSEDRNKYPDYGEQNGYFYTYIGVPFENAVTAPAIETGSYVGTGTYGASNPNSLTFDFEPKVVIITPGFVNTDNLDGHGYIFTNGAKNAASFGDYSGGSRSYYSINITWGQNKITFYAGGNDGAQCNKSNYKYHYIAIG